ncbi:hypothetical protein EON76_02545 [bacterium]|nr:MAG: hypothetical protein EON76_02545 [bacterium]
MKDIDFDELDRAVNSLMGGAASIKPDEPDPKTLTIATTLKDDEAPVYEKLEQAAERIGNETLVVPVERTEVLSLDDIDGEGTAAAISGAPDQANDTTIGQPVQTQETKPSAPEAPAVVKRPAGRFMDVMHPSSDMKNGSNGVSPSVAVPPSQVAPVAAPSREGITLNPFEQQTQPEEAQSPSRPSEELFAPVEQPTEELDLSSEELSHLNAEFATLDQSTPPAPEPEFIVTPAPATAVEPAAFEPVIPQEPLVSPFLPDAKVEKRPLGAGMPFTAPETEVAADIESMTAPVSSIQEVDAQRAPDAQPEVSAEFHSDLMAIESGANVALEPAGTIDDDDAADETTNPIAATTESTPETTASPLIDSREDVQSVSETAEEIQPSNVVEPVVQSDIMPAGPQSIAQQYSELPDSGDKESGSIYDVNDYHKPVSHPAKTGSGWLWVVIIVVIIAICGGGAAAFYFLTQNA